MSPAVDVEMTPEALAAEAAAAAASTPLAIFSGSSADDDYIAWRVRVEARLRSAGLWNGPTGGSPPSGARDVIASALAGDALAVAGDVDARRMLQQLDDRYIPKRRRKTTFAERFAADPAHFETFRNMLNDASSGEDDDDFNVDDEEESDGEEGEGEPLVPEGEVETQEDGYDSEEDEDYVVDEAKLVEDAKDEDPEEKEVVKEE